ncbi:leucine-rich repeat domain-containing protein [Ascoidea rubescens DSM 1968]|uniref:L domain-like protein n=1 Tax=Ascoidea rubescens DSM 1968 TaxID=1344418 RepID=A0A1D2VFW9_9ASCO|nr:L domain-like protein [Ascoidea rubescens DSM 1968]ODV60420.1 L domain-like protein [Ascoidea rubescens DSM 1968]
MNLPLTESFQKIFLKVPDKYHRLFTLSILPKVESKTLKKMESNTALKSYNSVIINLTANNEFVDSSTKNTNLFTYIDYYNKNHCNSYDSYNNPNDFNSKKLDIPKDVLHLEGSDFFKLNNQHTKLIQNLTILLDFFKIDADYCNILVDILKKTENLQKINLIIYDSDSKLCLFNHEKVDNSGLNNDLYEIWNKFTKLLILLNSDSLNQININSGDFSVDVSKYFWFLNQLTEDTNKSYSTKNAQFFLNFESFNKSSLFFKEQKTNYTDVLVTNDESNDSFINESTSDLNHWEIFPTQSSNFLYQFSIGDDIFFKELNSFMKFSVNYSFLNSQVEMQPFPPFLKIKTLGFQGIDFSKINDLTNKAEHIKLDFSKNTIFNARILSILINLSFLNLAHSQIEDISFLANLINLRTLNLSDNFLREVSCLGKLIHLNNLNLDDNDIVNIDFIIHLKELRRLSFSINSIESIDSLSELKKLVNLEGNYNKIQKIDPIIKLQKLEELSLNCNKISELKEINKLENLVKLNLHRNLIKEVKEVFFSADNSKKFSKLRKIKISGNQIEDLKNIYIPENLEYFDFSWNKINKFSIKDWENISKLKIIKLDQNSLKGLKNFKIPNSIEKLFLDHNNLKNFPLNIIKTSTS